MPEWVGGACRKAERIHLLGTYCMHLCQWSIKLSFNRFNGQGILSRIHFSPEKSDWLHYYDTWNSSYLHFQRVEEEPQKHCTITDTQRDTFVFIYYILFIHLITYAFHKPSVSLANILCCWITVLFSSNTDMWWTLLNLKHSWA